MPYEHDLKEWVLEAIDAHGGEANLVNVCKYIWDHHENQLRSYGERFYTWQYDTRWAAQYLRNDGFLVGAKEAPRGIWRRRRAAA
jgi:hypothetical protein